MGDRCAGSGRATVGDHSQRYCHGLGTPARGELSIPGSLAPDIREVSSPPTSAVEKGRAAAGKSAAALETEQDDADSVAPNCGEPS
jgi:hypothetical protein